MAALILKNEDMQVIKITSDDVKQMAEYTEKMLHYGGRLMSAIEDMTGEGSEMGERRGRRMGERGYMGERDHMDDMEMGERDYKGTRTGVYYRYR